MNNLKKSLFEKLVQKTKELGRRVSFSEMRADSSMPDPNQYAFYYGSFDEASKMAEATVRLSGKVEPKERGDLVIPKKKQKRLSLIAERDNLDKTKEVRKMSESINNIENIEKIEQAEKVEQVEKPENKPKDVHRRWTADEVKEVVRKYYDKYGKLPTNEWLCSKNGAPQSLTVKRYLGNDKKDWLKAIGVEEPESKKVELLMLDAGAVSNEEAPKDEMLDEKIVDNKKAETCEVEKELIDLIGQDGKLKQLGDISDLLAEIKIEKQFVLRFGRIRATINLLATIDE